MSFKKISSKEEEEFPSSGVVRQAREMFWDNLSKCP